MLSKIQSTVLTLVAAAFALFAVWGVAFPVDQLTMETLVNLIFALLAGILGGAGFVAKYFSKNQVQSLGQIQSTVLIIVGAAFAILPLWGVLIPTEQGLVEALINLIFVLLAGFGVGAAYISRRASA